jgi:hypothetical protein
MEWIYFVIIFFYILNAISKATKKKQQEEQKMAAIKQMNRRVEARPVPRQQPTKFEEAAEAFTDVPLGDVMQYITEKMSARSFQERQETTEFDVTSRVEPAETEETGMIAREHSTASHFHSAEALRSNVHDFSKLATAPRFAAPTFAFAQKQKTPIKLSLHGADLRKYFIISEILGKPKALRK